MDDADATDDADNVDNYSRVISITQLKALSCAKMEEKNTVTNNCTNEWYMLQPPRCMNIENTQSVRQTGNRTKNTYKHSKQTQNKKLLPLQDWKG